MNAPAKIAALPPVTKIDVKHGKRIEEISLAACALFGLVHFRGPVCHDHQAVVMGHLDTCFGFTPAESERASDMLFEATLNHSITDDDLHDIMRDKLGMFDEVTLPSGDVHRKRWSTSNRAMNEADRADYLNKCISIWSTWTGIDPTTLTAEGQRAA